MRKLWDFHGGVHPPENKRQSTRTPIVRASLPSRLIVPLHQHIGAPSEALVGPGAWVAKGQKIAEAQDPLSVPVHAPTSGQVLEVSEHAVPHPSGLTDWCVVIEPDGEDRWGPLIPCLDYWQLEPAELLRRIREAGIAGMGGAGFPTDVKLRPPGSDRIRTLILNGAECEPYITADQVLMQERASQIVAGLGIMAHILEPEECLIAVEDNKPQALAALRDALAGTSFEVVAIPTKYPSGGEKQLVEILTGLQVPHNGLPADIGVVCQNVATAAAVYRAIQYGEPLISRVTTVTGEALRAPGNYEALIGTPLSHLLAEAGFEHDKAQRLILGGPMMGFALETPEVPLTKTTNCIIAATAKELPPPPPAQACIRCGMCEQACPMELLPQQLYWFSRSGEYEKAEELNLFDCIECGACSYVCPSTIPLVQYYRNTKGEIRHQRAEQMKADLARERFEARKRRLEQEQAEKEARRRARAETTAQAKSQVGVPRQGHPGRDETGTGDTTPTPSAAADRSQKQAKSAAVQAAIARAQARRSDQAPDRESLNKNLVQTRDKLRKMQAALQEARTSAPERVEKLETAVAKNEARVRAAERALEQAESSAQTPNTRSPKTGDPAQ